MDTMSAFAMGQMNHNKPPRVFDWDKAARRIRESGAVEAWAGLSGDWSCTGGAIYANGGPVSEDDTYTFLASTWATPELELDGSVEDCWVYERETDGWGPRTYWPESARRILRGDDRDV